MADAFYIAGGVLVVIALVVSFIGMRSDDFPSPTVLRIGTLLGAAVVVTTAVLAVKTSSEEAQHREHEENVAASEESESQDVEDQQVGTEDESSGEPSSSTESPEELGKQVFADQGCGGCHSLADADATGQIGPNLDEALVDQDEKFIRTSIVDPGDEVEAGFSDGIMPTTYGQDIAPEDLDALVAYLSSATQPSGKQK
ncbi:MAG: cytochrome c [Solirubrobacterales bacterium]